MFLQSRRRLSTVGHRSLQCTSRTVRFYYLNSLHQSNHSQAKDARTMGSAGQAIFGCILGRVVILGHGSAPPPFRAFLLSTP